MSVRAPCPGAACSRRRWRRPRSSSTGASSQTAARAFIRADRPWPIPASRRKRLGWGAGVGFADSRRLDEHFEKHGAEFGNISKQDYLRQAQLLRDAKAEGPILQTVRPDGVTTRFDRQTGAFIAYNPNGVIRTFFKPNDGERYFRRQAERGE